MNCSILKQILLSNEPLLENFADEKEFPFISSRPVNSIICRITSYNVCYTKLLRMKYITDFPVEMDNKRETCILREAVDSNVTTFFIDSYQYFDRLGLYCHFDDGDRFAFFCKAVRNNFV